MFCLFLQNFRTNCLEILTSLNSETVNETVLSSLKRQWIWLLACDPAGAFKPNHLSINIHWPRQVNYILGHVRVLKESVDNILLFENGKFEIEIMLNHSLTWEITHLFNSWSTPFTGSTRSNCFTNVIQSSSRTELRWTCSSVKLSLHSSGNWNKMTLNVLS